MRNASLCVLMALTGLTASAQRQIDFSILFPTDIGYISETDIVRLALFVDTLPLADVLRIDIYGNTDDVASDEYNIALSEKRANAVADYFLEAGIPANLIHRYFHGETKPISPNDSEFGRRKNRRTDVVVFLEDCNRDTTLVYPNGTRVTVNACDVIGEDACFDFVEIMTQEQMEQLGYTTTTSIGEPLISAGMFNIEICPNTCAEVLVPARMQCIDSAGMQLWRAAGDGTWANPTSDLQVVEMNGSLYYQMQICESRAWNIDVKQTPVMQVKFKGKRGLKITDLVLTAGCPLIRYAMSSNLPPKRKVRMTIPCMGDVLDVAATAIDRKGNTVHLSAQQLNEVKHRILFGKCKTDEVLKQFLFFKIKKKKTYRKYLFKP